MKSEYINRGSFGCVFSPSFPCLNHTTIKKGDKYVGKVFCTQHGYENELKKIKIIEKIDKKGLFTIPLEDNCNIRITKEISETCPCLKDKKGKTGKQMIFKYGGVSLYDLFHDKNYNITFSNLIKLFIAFFEGLINLKNAGYAHLDIRRKNILFHEDKLYLIDYGFLSTLDELKESRYLKSFKTDIWPPEFKAKYVKKIVLEISDINEDLSAIPKKHKINFRLPKYNEKQIKTLMNKMILASLDTKLFSTLHPNYIQETSKFVDDVIKGKKTLDIAKVDVYAMGMLFVDIIELYSKHKKLYDISEQYYKLFLHLIEKMTEIDHNNRASLEQVHEKLKEITSLNTKTQ